MEQLLLHQVHVWSNVAEELVIALTQVVQTSLAVAVVDETVLWTFAVTGEQIMTLLTLAGQLLTLHLRKPLLLL